MLGLEVANVFSVELKDYHFHLNSEGKGKVANTWNGLTGSFCCALGQCT